MRTYIQTIDKLNYKGFRPLPYPTTRILHREEKNAQVMYRNLWSMFEIPANPRDPEKNGYGRQISVSDFAWTNEVKEAFYAWGDHPKLVKRMKAMRGMTWGMWVLDSEPCNFEDDNVTG